MAHSVVVERGGTLRKARRMVERQRYPSISCPGVDGFREVLNLSGREFTQKAGAKQEAVHHNVKIVIRGLDDRVSIDLHGSLAKRMDRRAKA
jgi:hypothetical protein